jgi:hypothetical protein
LSCNGHVMYQRMDVVYLTAFHPRTDGQTEHMNRWIENYLRQFVSGRQDNWSTLLPIAEFTHNSWKHEHTKHTPCYTLCYISVPRVDLSQPLTVICTTGLPYCSLPDSLWPLPLSQYLAVSFHKC